MFRTILILSLLGLTLSQQGFSSFGNNRRHQGRNNNLFNSNRRNSQSQFRPQPQSQQSRPQTRFQPQQQTLRKQQPQQTFRQQPQQTFRQQPPQQTFQPQQQPQRRIGTTPRLNRPFIRLLRSNTDGPYADGSYVIDFASEDGISRSETGANAGVDPRTGYDIHTKTGSYSYISPEGIPVQVSYVADQNGFRASTPNLPLGPAPPPHAVQQILAAQRAFASRGLVFTSGFDNHPALRG